MGERRERTELRSDELRRSAELRARRREPVLGPLSGLSLRPLLHGLERVQPRSVSLAAVQLEGQGGRARDLRETLSRRVRRDQGGQLTGAGRDRGDLRAWP